MIKDVFFRPKVNVVVKMNSGREFTIKDVVFLEVGYGKKKADVHYVDAKPHLVGGKNPIRKGPNSEFMDLEREINNTFSTELYFSIIGIEKGVVHLECIV